MSSDDTVATWEDILAAVADEVEGSENAHSNMCEARAMIDEVRILDWAAYRHFGEIGSPKRVRLSRGFSRSRPG